MDGNAMEAHSRRIADENLALASEGVTVIVILASETGMSLAVRGNRGVAEFAMNEAVKDIEDDEGWTARPYGRA